MSRRNKDALFSAHAILAALKSSIRVLRWGMAALVLVYLFSGITTIRPNENGLVLRFGRLLPQTHAPGLLLALPPPFDEVVHVPRKTVQERILDGWYDSSRSRGIDDALHPIDDPYTLTGDANIIRAKFVVRYSVADSGAYTFAASDRESLLDAVIYRAGCRVMAGLSVDDVLTTQRNFAGEETMRLAQGDLDRLGLGVVLLAVEAREIEPPKQIEAAFQDVVSAKVEGKTLIEPANSYRASAIPKSQSDSFRIKQEADGYARQLTAKAEGEASAFLAVLKEYQANPEVVHARLYSEMIRDVMHKARISTVMTPMQGQLRLLLSPQGGSMQNKPETPEAVSAPQSSGPVRSGPPRPE
jgi:membrane protease subunit HflK